MDDYITRNEHNVFAEKIEAEEERQNHRISELETTVKQIQQLTISVEKMAVNIEAMVKSQNNMASSLEKQGQRLDAIEREPAQKWEKAVWLVIAALIGAGITAILANIGLKV